MSRFDVAPPSNLCLGRLFDLFGFVKLICSRIPFDRFACRLIKQKLESLGLDGLVAKLVASPGKGSVAKPIVALPYLPLPHDGNVSMDRLHTGSTVITHLISLEK